MQVLLDVIRSALQELADIEVQRRVWEGRGDGSEVSSFTECVSRLFDDSGLDLALERDEQVLDPQIVNELAALGDLVVKIDSFKPPDEIIEDPRMGRVRQDATKILRALDEMVGRENARDP